MDGAVTRAEHDETVKRLEAEDKRQNARLDALEKQSKDIMDLAMSVRELATSVKQMADVQKEQGDRLESLEKRDGDMWRKVVGYIITAVVGILIGFVFKQIGM